ncbi:hypothetical protein CDAR_486001 [Caerostris darwini]|uniref:Uncharacterized protein n=1 Tax=Caerostris darwini TaxID=1538125 RepID=A0AAV4WIK3_9ARAC|nr:hypothetical protein CDAR_486001 [Caerostris darwini]
MAGYGHEITRGNQEFERNLGEKKGLSDDDSSLRSVFLITDKLRMGQRGVSGEFPFEVDESSSFGVHSFVCYLEESMECFHLTLSTLSLSAVPNCSSLFVNKQSVRVVLTGGFFTSFFYGLVGGGRFTAWQTGPLAASDAVATSRLTSSVYRCAPASGGGSHLSPFQIRKMPPPLCGKTTIRSGIPENHTVERARNRVGRARGRTFTRTVRIPAHFGTRSDSSGNHSLSLYFSRFQVL